AGAIQIWDVESWQELAAPTDMLGRDVCSVAFSPDGRHFAAGACNRGGVTLWRIRPRDPNLDAGGRLQLQAIARPANDVNAWGVSFSRDSALLGWVESDEYRSKSNTVHLWELANSRECSSPPVRLAGLGFAFHPDGKHLLFVEDTGVAEAWDIATQQKTFSF